MPDDEWMQEAVRQLDGAGVPSPSYEAAALAAHVRNTVPEEERSTALGELVRRRCDHEPLERLIGSVRFREIELLVGPGVFVPQPETSPVVDWAVAALRRAIAAGITTPRCVDLCTGSGTIAVSIAAEVAEAEVHAVELDGEALVWTRRNVAHNDVQVTLHQGEAATALPAFDGRIDLVASNPPYVAIKELPAVARGVRDHDPLISLIAGHDGLDVIRDVEAAARRLLRPGGHVIVEHSDRQGESAPAVFADSAAWDQVRDHPDQLGLPRFVTARRR